MDNTRVSPTQANLDFTKEESKDISMTEMLIPEDLTAIEENKLETVQSKPLIQETSHIVRFRINQCIAGLVIHASFYILSPFSMILIRLIYGKYLAYNMGFGYNMFFGVESMNWMWIYFSVFTFYHLEDRVSDFYGLFISAGIIVFLRNLMVAIKYSYFVQEDWNEMKTRYLKTEEIASKLLILSWKKIPDHIIDTEISAAFKRRRIDEKKMCISFHGSAPAYFKDNMPKNVKTEEQTCIIHKNNTCADLETVARYFVGKVNEKVSQTHIRKLVITIAILYMLAPHAVKVAIHGPESYQTDPIEILFYILSFPVVVFNCFTFLSFQVIGAMDFKRRNLLLEICSAVISCEYEDINTENAKLDMTEAGTVESWYILRSSLLDFGLRYTQRIFLYASLILPLCLLVIVIILLQMVRVIDTTYNIYFISPIILTMTSACIITYIIFRGVRLNEMFGIHKDILLHRLEDLPATPSNSSQGVADVKLAKRSIKRKMQMLKQDSVMRPVKMFGFTVSQDLFSKLMALVLSGLLAILQLLYSS